MLKTMLALCADKGRAALLKTSTEAGRVAPGPFHFQAMPMGYVYQAQLVFREREFRAIWERVLAHPTPFNVQELKARCQADPALDHYIKARVAEARAKHETEQDTA